MTFLEQLFGGKPIGTILGGALGGALEAGQNNSTTNTNNTTSGTNGGLLGNVGTVTVAADKKSIVTIALAVVGIVLTLVMFFKKK